jgi:hypothetical protein
LEELRQISHETEEKFSQLQIEYKTNEKYLQASEKELESLKQKN